MFITQRAEEYLGSKHEHFCIESRLTCASAGKLLGSKFGTREDIIQMKNEFDKTTKLRFSNPSDPSYIRFGTPRDKDPAYNIRSGQLKLPG